MKHFAVIESPQLLTKRPLPRKVLLHFLKYPVREKKRVFSSLWGENSTLKKDRAKHNRIFVTIKLTMSPRLDLDKSKCLLVSLDQELCSLAYQSWLTIPKSSSELNILIKRLQPMKIYWPDSPLEKDQDIKAREWTTRSVLVHAMGGNHFFYILRFLKAVLKCWLFFRSRANFENSSKCGIYS